MNKLSLFSNGFFNEVDDFLNDVSFFNKENNSYLENEVFETDNDYQIRLFMAGLNKQNDISLNFDNQTNQLTVVLQRNKIEKDDTTNLIKSSVNYKKVVKSYSFSNNVDSDKISAEYKDGVLNIIIPKTNSKNNQKTIKIF